MQAKTLIQEKEQRLMQSQQLGKMTKRQLDDEQINYKLSSSAWRSNCISNRNSGRERKFWKNTKRLKKNTKRLNDSLSSSKVNRIAGLIAGIGGAFMKYS